MSDTTSGRVEPVIEHEPTPQTAIITPPPPSPPSSSPAASLQQPDRPANAANRALFEQLSRIEDKTARIEEKYARTESLLLRVEDKVEATSNRTGELASQSDLNALSNRVGSLPGYGALILTAIIAGLIAAAATYGVTRYGIPGVLPPLTARATAPSAMPPPPPVAAPAVVPR